MFSSGVLNISPRYWIFGDVKRLLKTVFGVYDVSPFILRNLTEKQKRKF